MLSFEIDVRMADSFSHFEINDFDRIRIKKNVWDKIYDWWWFKVRKNLDFQKSKTFRKDIFETDYYLRDDQDSEQIYLKIDLITLKSIFGRKYLKKNLELNLYSKSGRKIYSKKITLDKYKLIENKEVRLGIEPS